jgi:hypothetical protein
MSQKSLMLGLSGKRVYEPVELPQPIGAVLMRTLTAAESIEVANYRFDDSGKPVPGREKYVSAKRLSLAIVDSERNLMFGEEDLEAMSEWPESLSDRLLAQFWKMNQAEYVGSYLKNVTPAA